MKAVEVTGTLDEKGRLLLDEPIKNFQPSGLDIQPMIEALQAGYSKSEKEDISTQEIINILAELDYD